MQQEWNDGKEETREHLANSFRPLFYQSNRNQNSLKILGSSRDYSKDFLYLSEKQEQKNNDQENNSKQDRKCHPCVSLLEEIIDNFWGPVQLKKKKNCFRLII